MPKTQAKRGLSPRELDALRRRYLAEDKQAASERKWQLANDIASGINDIVGRGVIAPIAGGLGDVNQALWDAGAWVNNKIKDVEVATGMVKQPRYVQPTQGNAYLGSEDIGNRMERAGLVSSERRPMTELAASLVSPSAAAKTAINAPKTAMNMLRMADNLEAPYRGVRNAQGMYIPRGQMGAIENLWHGSPHTFDRFDLSKIGIGEGAQAYGHGAYWAENTNTAKNYINAGGTTWNIDGKKYFATIGKNNNNAGNYAASALEKFDGNKELAIKSLSDVGLEKEAKAILKNAKDFGRDEGNLYQARLAWDADREATDPLSPEHFLDWDKPLSEQPDIIAKLSPEIRSRIASAIDSYGNNKVTGQYLVDVAMLDDAASAGVPREQATKYVTNKLSELGIPGSRYLDAGSRGAGEGTSNYVVFDDKLIDIQSRNGQPIVKPGAPQANPQAGRTSIIDQKSVDELFAPGMSIQKISDTGFDPRFDDRTKEQQRLNALTIGIEGNDIPEPKIISLADYEGYPVITSMSDRTAAGGKIVRINDVDLDMPVERFGGQGYPFRSPGQAWASQPTPASTILNYASEIKKATGKDPLFAPWRMAPTGGDFYTGTGETMMSYAASAMDKKTKAALDKSIKQYIPDWAGVGTEKGREQFRKTPDAIRKEIKAMMDKEYRNKGGLNIGEARLAVADPKQLTAKQAQLMNVGIIHADQPLIPQSGHPSYSRGVPGEGLGRIDKDIGVYEMLVDAAKLKGVKDPTNPADNHIRSLIMKPYVGILTADLLKKLGY